MTWCTVMENTDPKWIASEKDLDAIYEQIKLKESGQTWKTSHIVECICLC